MGKIERTEELVNYSYSTYERRGETMFFFIIAVPILALMFAAFNFRQTVKRPAGTSKMQEISMAIYEGADAFIKHEYKVVFTIAIPLAVILGIITEWYVGVAFILGAFMSSLAGLVGMRIATKANVRVSNTARETKHIGKTLKVAFQSGSVMGLSVAGFALLGLTAVYAIFGMIMGQLDASQLVVTRNWMGISFIPFAMTVSGYALGCSLIAMFDRVGGGVYTKAADMGADLVGKTELGIPEDDPRNPATIADNVGDNVGDVAGLGADLLESYVGSLISAVVLISYMFYVLTSGNIPYETARKLVIYPVIFANIGVIAAMIGILYVIVKKPSNKPHRELNISLWTSASVSVVLNGIVTWFYLGGSKGLDKAGFRAGVLSPWLASITGIISGIIIGWFAEYYTSDNYKPTIRLSESSKSGTALVITNGLSLGMKSVLFPSMTLLLAIMVADRIAGLYGVAMASIGMLSFVAATVSVDTYGPIADNAGGISEMCKLDPEVRAITDRLDMVGNTTAAIGKGFAIGSAALAALSLFASYMYSHTNPGEGGSISLSQLLQLNMLNSSTLAGAVLGAALPYYFSGILINAVAKAAMRMVDEVRRQFRVIPGLMEGTAKPDYRTCVEISASGALKEMKLPAFISVATPIVTGFLFGPKFVGGLLIGTTLSGIMLALFTANAGGAWDNGKKHIEQGKIPGLGKGTDAHKAAVVGDTVGDPLKDTVGPSLDILIKIMAVVSLIMVSIFKNVHLF